MEVTEVGCTTHTLGEQVQPQVVESPPNVELVESDNLLSQAREKIIEDTEFVSTSQDLKNKEESEAVDTEETSQDSFSEGSIHIKVSEPFSLSEDHDIYLSDDCNEDKTENVIKNRTGTSPIGQNKKCLSEQEEAVVFIGLDVKSPRKPNLAAETETQLQSIQPKRRGRPPKSTKTEIQLQNRQPRRRGRPPKSTNNKYIVSSNKLPNEIKPQKNVDILEKPASSSNDFSKRKTKTVSQTSHDSSFADEKQRNKNIAIEEQSCSINNNTKNNSAKILSAKDLIERTLSKLTSGNCRSKLNTVSNGENPEEKGKFRKGQNILGDSKIKRDNSPNKVCKKPIDAEKVNLKSQRVTVIDPTELINRTLAKLTHKKDFQEKVKATEEKANSKCCDDKLSHTKQNTRLEIHSEVSILSSEKKETFLKELIDRTLAKVTTVNHPYGRRKTDELESSDSFEESLTEKNEEKILNLRPLVRRTSSKPFVGAFYRDKRENKTKKLASKIKEGELQNSISFCKGVFEISNKKEILEGEESKMKITMNQSTLKKQNLSHEENTQPKTKYLVGKDNMYKRVVDSLSKKNKRASLKPPVQEENVNNEDDTPLADELPLAKVKGLLKNNEDDTPLADELPLAKVKGLLKMELDKKNNCSSVLALTHTKSESKIRNPLKSKQPNSRVKKIKSNDLCAKTKTVKRISGKPYQQLVVNKKDQFMRKKQTAVPPKKNAKRKLKVNRTKLLLVKDSEACIGLDSLPENRMTSSEQTLEDQKGNCSNLSIKISSNGKVKLEEQLKAIPRVVLQDCQKTGKLISLTNEELAIKNQFQDKKNLTLKPETHPSNKTDNQATLDSGECFGQLELSPSPKFVLINGKSHMSLPPSKTNFGLGKDLQMNEIVSIDDDDLDTYTDALPSAHELDGPKESSVSSSQKQGSIENLPSSVAPMCSNVSLPLKRLSSSTGRKSRSENLPVSPHKKSDSIDDLDTYTDALPSAHKLDGPKESSVSSSQKQGSIENLSSSVAPSCSNVTLPLKSLSSSTDRKSRSENLQISPHKKSLDLKKGSQADEIITIEDDDDENGLKISSAASIPPHILDRMKKYSRCSLTLMNEKSTQTKQKWKQFYYDISQKSESVNQFKTTNIKGQELNKGECKSVSGNQCLPIEITARTIPFSTQSEPGKVFHIQSNNGTHNFFVPKSVQQSDEFILSKLKDYLLKNGFLPNQQSNPTNQESHSEVVKQYSLNDNVVSECLTNSVVPQNTSLKKDIPPAVPFEILAKVDQSSVFPPNVCFSAPVLSKPTFPIPSGSIGSAPAFPPQAIPIATGSKNYYFTPLFVLDGEKVIPLSEKNAPQCTVGNSDDSNSQSKNSCKSTVITTSQIVIDTKTIKPLPNLDFGAASASSVLPSSITSAKFEMISTSQSLSIVNERIKDSSCLLTVSSTQKDLKSPTKRKQACFEEVRSETKLSQVVHCSSSIQSNIVHDHLHYAKRKQLEAPGVTMFISSDQGGKEKVKHTKRKQPGSTEDRFQNEIHQDVHCSSSTHSNIECDGLSAPKRRRSQASSDPEPQKLVRSNKSVQISCALDKNSSNNFEEASVSSTYPSNECGETTPLQRRTCQKMSLPVQSCERMSEVSSSNRYDSNPKQTGGQKNIEKQLKGKKENFSSFNVCKIKEITREFSLPHSLSNNLNKQSTNTLEEKRMHTKKTNPKMVSKRTKSKEEELEECLDGVPPFIKDVFKCENIRDGFDNKDLIFVLSLLSDIEEMTISQRVIFQSRAVEILNDVFKSPLRFDNLLK